MTSVRQTTLLKQASAEHIDNHGALLCRGIEDASKPLLKWLLYLKTSQATGIADILLDGVKSAIVETAGCLSLGLVRPALLAIRAQVDMLLAWLFFKDHPIEWEHIQIFGEGYKLKQGIIEYIAQYTPKYKKRYGLLMQAKNRKEDDPYRLLSAHIHCQSIYCIPSIDSLQSLIWPLKLCEECIDIQKEVTEFMNDILFSCYADRWTSLPSSIVKDTKNRLSARQKIDFFA